MLALRSAHRTPLFDNYDNPVKYIDNPLWVAAIFGARGDFCRDRTGVLNRFGIYRTTPVPKWDLTVTGTQRNIEDIINERARYLINNIDRSITVLWSGGVDSTLVMCALISNGIPRDKLKVYCTRDSVEEAPNFMEWVRSNGYEIHPKSAGYVRRDFDRNHGDSFILSGDGADQLFGSVYGLRSAFLHNMNWIAAWKLCFSTQISKTLPKNKTFDFLQEWMNEYSGRNIETFGEFLWWINFALKYDAITEHFRLEFEGKYDSHQDSFFDTREFQQWSVNNFPSIRKHNQWLSHKYYKKPFKDYIYSVWHDSDYRDHKGKRGSWNFHYFHNTMIGKLIVHDNEGFKVLNYDGYDRDTQYLCHDSRAKIAELLKPYRKEEDEE